jgi:hypothetical protein
MSHLHDPLQYGSPQPTTQELCDEPFGLVPSVATAEALRAVRALVSQQSQEGANRFVDLSKSPDREAFNLRH